MPLPSAEAALELLQDPGRWPDIASDRGRFTALRAGGLLGQTFEIELNVGPARRLPAFLRAYVTCTAVLTGAELESAVAALVPHTPTVADGERPLAMIELTTHARHPLGAAISRLLIASSADGPTVRDIGAWDPLPFSVKRAYDHGGHDAQVEFWSPEPVASSMLAQLAVVTGS